MPFFILKKNSSNTLGVANSKFYVKFKSLLIELEALVYNPI
jgi:hypothetical protein